ncbi:retrotransposon protein, putative, ty1-copia subclass [Tanacetum coccineum]
MTTTYHHPPPTPPPPTTPSVNHHRRVLVVVGGGGGDGWWWVVDGVGVCRDCLWGGVEALSDLEAKGFQFCKGSDRRGTECSHLNGFITSAVLCSALKFCAFSPYFNMNYHSCTDFSQARAIDKENGWARQVCNKKFAWLLHVLSGLATVLFCVQDEDLIGKMLSGSPCLETLELTSCHFKGRIPMSLFGNFGLLERLSCDLETYIRFSYGEFLGDESETPISMKLSRCVFNPPNGAIRWDKLKFLCIDKAEYDGYLIANLLSTSPCLETLQLNDCCGLRQIDVTSKSVKNLVLSYSGDSLSADYHIEINAPYILSLTIKGNVYLEELLLENVASLVKADLNYWVSHDFAEELGRDQDDVEEELLRGLLSSLCHVNEIALGDCYCLQGWKLGLCTCDRDSLETSVSCDEIKSTIWDCGSNKAPRPDGFSFAFIKKYWDLLKMDICGFVNSFFESGSMPQVFQWVATVFIKWDIEGDENSKFFHEMINQKRRTQAITGLCTRDRDSLETSVSCDEIKSAIWDCGSNKAPRPDGFSFMAQPVQNINHSAFRSMFEREKLSGNNFNDLFCQLKLVLRVEKKMFVIEQPLPAAPAANSDAQVLSQWNTVYDAYNELKAMFEKQAGVERFDLIQTFHACKQEEGKRVTAYVIQMKGYVDQLEHLGYMLPQVLIVGLILNGLTKDFSGFVRNYNMHNMGKTIDELHAMLIEYETPQVMMIKGGKIQKAKKKLLKVKGKGKANGKGNDKQVYIPKPKNPKPSAKEHLAKDDTCHHYKEGFREARKLKQGALYLYVSNDVRAQVEAIGSYDLVLPNGLVICLDNCHYTPSITRGVMLVHRLVENGFVQCFTDFGISVSNNNVFYFNVIPSNGIYEIDMHDLVPNVNSIYNVSTKRAKYNLDSTYLWHCRLAHISKKRIEKLQQEGLLKSTNDESFNQCVSCLSGKITRKSFPHRSERATDLLGIIHTDVCGLLKHMSRQGASYFITFTDNYSHYGYVYLLKPKHEAFETFKVFKNEVENQLGKTIKALRSNRGGEYISQEFKDYHKACGIVQQLTSPYTPQHNDVSERRNRTLLDMVRSMMNLTTLSLSFWDYALESATRILNIVPTKKVDKTPYELWYGKVPNLTYLKVWGCEALVKQDTPDKLQQRSVKCIFIGYPKETMGYYFYFPPENKIVVARYAEFFDKNLITQKVSGRAINLKEIQDEDTSPSKITSEIHMEVEGFEPPQEEEIPIRRSERSRRVPNRLCLNVKAEEHSLGDLNEPTSYKVAMLDSESNKWIDAMNAEIQSMMDNMVWVLVDLPPSCKTVGSKWIFKKKTDMDGIVHAYKARLVAKGYTQRYGVDFEKTFSPVADIKAIRILISVAAYYDYEIWQMDVKSSFLNGYLDEDIYMVQPEGFVNPNHPRKVCKLQRSIYSLKQASRSCNKRFDGEIKRFCFDQNLDEPCVYQKASGSNVTFLILYIDDIIIMGNHISNLQSVKDYLRKCFAMKDLGEAAFILGIKIYRDRSKRLIRLGQNAYMDKILKRYKMDNFKRGHIPMQERLDLKKTQGASTPKEVKRMQNVPYASAVRSIMYDTAVKNILKYLRNTKDMFLVYGGNLEAELRVDCYYDDGFETDIDDMKSLTGYVLFRTEAQ